MFQFFRYMLWQHYQIQFICSAYGKQFIKGRIKDKNIEYKKRKGLI